MKKIILASQSPRRKQLLAWAEIPFEVVVKETEEIFHPHLTVKEAAIEVAKQKALAVRQLVTPGSIILAADTIVVLKGRIIGKPANRLEAIRILQDLSRQKHIVITAVVITDGEKEISFTDSTEVYFHELTTEQIEFYVDKYQPYDKAGAYAIQEWIGVIGIQSINGDFYNVMGLPVSRVVKALQSFNETG
ncbi:MAG: septum formation protein Maf [Chitinophagaceae bacterium]